MRWGTKVGILGRTEGLMWSQGSYGVGKRGYYKIGRNQRMGQRSKDKLHNLPSGWSSVFKYFCFVLGEVIGSSGLLDFWE